jgi:hypothetical protein
VPARIKYKPGRARLGPPPKPPAPRAAPARPAPAPGAQSLPVDPAYDAATGSANRNLALSQAGLASQRQGLGQEYGLGVNAQGGVFNDPSNPYSRAAALQQSYERAQRGTNTSLAARGQLYSGSFQNAAGENVNQNSRGRDSLIRDFLARNQAITQAQLQAQSDYTGAMGGAGAERIGRALENRPDAASVPQQPLVQAPMVAAPKPATKPKTRPRTRPKPRTTPSPTRRRGGR